MFKAFAYAFPVLALTIGGALAAPLAPGQFGAALSGGVEFPAGGDVHGGATADVPLSAVAALRDAGAPPLALPAGAAAAQLRIGARSYDDIYGHLTRFGLEGAYGLTGGRELFGGVAYAMAGEGTVQVGTAAVVSAAGATLVEVPVTGTFGDLESWSVEAGLRQHFGAGAFRPYVAARVGVAFVDEIRASFRVPALNITTALNDVPFYDSSTAFTGGLDAGLSYDIGERFALQLEAGLRYVADLAGDDSAIGGLGLAGINDGGERLAIPVTLRLSWRY
jgi:hypothetical protein